MTYENRVAVIIGSAACLWDDLDHFEAIAEKMGWKWDAVAVNHAGLAINHPIEHWVSCHPILIHHFREARRCYTHHTLGENGPMITHGPRGRTGQDLTDKTYDVSSEVMGNSALFGIWCMLHLGYERVVLAGIPFDGNRTFYHPKQMQPEHSDDIRHIRLMWSSAATNGDWVGKVFSMSGWTAALLGTLEDPSPVETEV
tara:strand:- start:397 stop:993 length:597 start_codon:yes stop_codon:yes gene_type:complete